MRGPMIFWGVVGCVAGGFGIAIPGLFAPFAIPVAIVSGFAVVVGVATCDIVDAIERSGKPRPREDEKKS